MKLNEDEVLALIGIGFCQPKFYKRRVWLRAKKLMDEVICPNKLAYPSDFGRGKGKYDTDFDIDDVKQKAIEIMSSNGQLISC